MQLEKHTILIAEDNEVDVFLIRRSLDQAGLVYDAEIAHNGQEALLRIVQSTQSDGKRFDGVLLDLNLVTHTGLEVLARIRENAAVATTPVVILTSSSSPKDQRLAWELGVSAFLTKPLDLGEWTGLGKQIKNLFSRNTAVAASSAD